MVIASDQTSLAGVGIASSNYSHPNQLVVRDKYNSSGLLFQGLSTKRTSPVTFA
jgi:hypothetical protein